MSEKPITQWISDVKRKDPDAERALWNHYFERLVRLASTRMFGLRGTVYDEEDAAVSAIHSVFRGLQSERFPSLKDRDNLWRLLVLVTKRKLRAQWRKENAKMRAQPANGQTPARISIEEVICSQPTPEFVTDLMDETEHLFKLLEDETLRRIALFKLDGLTHDEIAEHLNCTSRTVYRKMERIRATWQLYDAE